jgi:hypothetical protein
MVFKCKKVTEPTVNRAKAEFLVEKDGVVIARLFQREASKTGFKKGRCIGQVKVDGWFFILETAPGVHGNSEGFSGGPKWRTRKAAFDALQVMFGVST